MFAFRPFAVSSIVLASAALAAEFPREGIEERVAAALKAPAATGLLVYYVEPGSQAAKASFEIGDILTDYDGQPVERADTLVKLARDAAKRKQPRILTIRRRGGVELEAELDPAPLGVRLIEVREGQGRALWRPATPYQPDYAEFERRVSEPVQWRLLRHGDKTIGFARDYLARDAAGENAFVYRAQTRIGLPPDEETTDTTIWFQRDDQLSPTGVRLTVRGKLALEVRRQGDKWTGRRGGVPVTADCPRDAVSSHLAGLLATTMPVSRGACRRMSFLDSASITAAPFADLAALGEETVASSRGDIRATRFELAVFGEAYAHYWVDADRSLAKIRFASGVESTPMTTDLIKPHFADIETAFEPIDQLPRPAPSSPLGN